MDTTDHVGIEPARQRDDPGSAVAAFEAVVTRAPDVVALQDRERRLTYAELDAAANRVAEELLAGGLGHEERVAVAAERSAAAIVGFLGVLKAGGAYVPLDPRDPTTRLRFMLDDTSTRVVLAPQEFVEDAWTLRDTVIALEPLLEDTGEAPSAPRLAIDRHDLAYVMYTSGSTGRPKGVAIEHRAIVGRVRGASAFMPRAGERMLQVSALDFDAQTWEIWSGLLNGASMVIVPPGRPDPGRIGALLAEADVNVALLSPGLFHQMVEANLDDLGRLRLLLVGGDVMSATHARRFVRAHPAIPLVNLYGPTEVTVCCTAEVVRRVPPGDRVPIGTALGNSTLYVLDDRGNEVPRGDPGELHIGGDCVARGYLNLPDATSERFLADPFSGVPGSTMYRTGDSVRRRLDGSLDFLGRIDDQLKIRGFRIEPAEIETHLVAAPGVSQAAVVGREDVPGHLRLVAYVVADGTGRALPAVELRRHLASLLPDHMIPSAFVTVDALPLTARGQGRSRRTPRARRRGARPPGAPDRARGSVGSTGRGAVAGGAGARRPGTRRRLRRARRRLTARRAHPRPIARGDGCATPHRRGVPRGHGCAPRPTGRGRSRRGGVRGASPAAAGPGAGHGTSRGDADPGASLHRG